MLTIEAAVEEQQSSRGKIGLALAGGGPLGAFYELGALHALQECVDGLDLTRLHGYVGVSSGAIIAAALANGLSTARLGRLFLSDATHEFPMSPGIVMRPAFGEYLHRLLTVPILVGDVLWKLAHGSSEKNWTDAFTPLLRVLPIGVFDNAPFEAYLRDMFSNAGRTNDFRRLKHSLRIIATDLNTSKEVRFGDPGYDRVPISRAIQASTALPGLYTPVTFNGRTYVDGALLRTMHASVVLERGAALMINVNPLVPFSATAPTRRHHNLVDAGLPFILSQTFRALIQSRMQVGMARYGQQYPHTDRILIEPDREDEAMFFVNVFSYAGRRRLLNHAYQRTRADLLAQSSRLAPIFKSHGLYLDVAQLRDQARSFQRSLGEVEGITHPAAAELSMALDRLTRLLNRAA